MFQNMCVKLLNWTICNYKSAYAHDKYSSHIAYLGGIKSIFAYVLILGGV